MLCYVMLYSVHYVKCFIHLLEHLRILMHSTFPQMLAKMDASILVWAKSATPSHLGIILVTH